ncbi:MAG TPA: hypothetical protein PLC61_07230 [Chitinophagales bacterium]|nr:hypothetical protein [Bacteroidia bacterium]HND46167.1 hypothetical protein [Chitinophagales bacterium]
MKTKTVSPSTFNKRKEWEAARTAAQRNDFLQTAIAIGRIHTKGGVSPKEIVSEGSKNGLKISLPHVYNCLKISTLPAKVQAYIRAEKINATDVLGVIHKHQSEKELLTIVQKMVAEREKQMLEGKKQKIAQNTKTIQEKIRNFLTNHNITPSKKDLKALFAITGKYTEPA